MEKSNKRKSTEKDDGEKRTRSDDDERYHEVSDDECGEANPRQKTRCLRQDKNVTNDADADDDAQAAEDDVNFPSVEEMRSGARVRGFSSLDTDTIYAILQFDKRAEEVNGEQKDNLILTLRAQGSRKEIEVRTTSVIQKSLFGKHKLEMMFTSHNFFICYLGQKKSKRSGNMYCNFTVSSKPK